MSHSFKKITGSRVRGFTLSEMLISLAIIIVMVTIVVSSQSTYSDRASIDNLADDIGLTLSEAQAYGIGVRQVSPGSSDFSAAYGISFNIIDVESSLVYIFFADIDNNEIYDGDWSCPESGTCDEYQSKKVISGGNSITSICQVRVNDTEMCNVSRVDISFARPDTRAGLIFFNTGGNPFSPQPDNVKGARVTVTSSKGTEKSIIVYNTGQISIQ